MKSSRVSMATLAGLLLVEMALASPAQAATAKTSKSTTTTVTALPNDLANTPASVIAEARTVHSEADLAKVSAAARHYIQTPVREVRTVTATSHAKMSSPSWQHFNNGCWAFASVWSNYNSFGWLTTRSTQRLENDCFDGNSIWSDPWGHGWQEAHWGWIDCGSTSEFSNWFQSRRLEYGTGAQWHFGLGATWCTTTVRIQSPEVFSYADGWVEFV